VLVSGGGSLRVEVNLADEVLVLYRGGEVALISHVSSGAGYHFCSPAENPQLHVLNLSGS
jgi:hypothetical protein